MDEDKGVISIAISKISEEGPWIAYINLGKNGVVKIPNYYLNLVESIRHLADVIEC
jgi:hypothetical protein